MDLSVLLCMLKLVTAVNGC